MGPSRRPLVNTPMSVQAAACRAKRRRQAATAAPRAASASGQVGTLRLKVRKHLCVELVGSVDAASAQPLHVGQPGTGLVQERGDLRPFEGDRLAFRVVLVVGRDGGGRADDVAECPSEIVDLGEGAGPPGGQTSLNTGPARLRHGPTVRRAPRPGVIAEHGRPDGARSDCDKIALLRYR
jgi:hypothetical protein